MRYEDHPQLGSESTDTTQWTDLKKFYPVPIDCNHVQGKRFNKNSRKFEYYEIKHKLKEIWEGELVNYHLFQCDNCGLINISIADKDTGRLLVASNLATPSETFIELFNQYRRLKQ